MTELETNSQFSVKNLEDSNKRQKLDTQSLEEEEEEEEENIICTICSEVWTNGGSHCLVSLKCGHLFGKSCITRWINERTQKLGAKKTCCPMCMNLARINDIRIVLPVKLSVKDTTQSDELRRELEAKKYSIREYQNSLELAQLALNLCKRELERVKESLAIPSQTTTSVTDQAQLTHCNSNEDVDNIPNVDNLASEANEKQVIEIEVDQTEIVKNVEEDVTDSNKLTIAKCKALSESRGVSRMMAISQQHNTAMISFRSTLNSHGIMKLDLLNMDNSLEYLPIHDGLVRDIQYSYGNQDLILSTSMDKTLKLFSSRTNSVHHTFLLGAPGWSCSFDAVDPNKLYCGLADGAIVVYDIRKPNTHLRKLVNTQFSKTPVHSIAALKKRDSRPIIYSAGLIQAFSWDCNNGNEPECTAIDVGDHSYKPYSLSSNNNNNILLSTRNQTSTKHTILDVNGLVVTSFNSLYSQKSLGRTYSYLRSTEETVICYTEEENNAVCIKGNVNYSQRIEMGSCPLDIKWYDSHTLAVLTDNNFHVLRDT